MILVTVGAQMPFDRMVRTVDRWAGCRGRSDVFAQIGLTALRPKNLSWTQFLEPQDFRKKVEEADAIVAHAGIGSILSALELGKPILVMPRRGDLRETRNDHQVATAKRFLAQGRIFVAFDEEHLFEKLDHLGELRPSDRISSSAAPHLLATISAFVRGDLTAASRLSLVPHATVDVDASTVESAVAVLEPQAGNDLQMQNTAG